MQVDELLPYLRENQETLIQEIRNGKYKPNPVRRVEIPKETKGEFRKLGVPTVVDRVVQQAIAQELSPIFEEQFSEKSSLTQYARANSLRYYHEPSKMEE